MLERPALKGCFRVETLASEGVFLLSEFGHHLLTGPLNEAVVPLIDGRRTTDEIAAALEERLPLAETYYAMLLLEQGRYIVEADDDADPGAAAFWDPLDVRPLALRTASIGVRALPGLSPAPLEAALRGLGVEPRKDADFHVVIADDYLRPELEAINREALTLRRPWMLVKPGGAVAWIGPIFAPGRTACWACLAARLRHNREVEGYLEHRGRPGPFPVSRPHLAQAVQSACTTAAIQAVRWAVTDANPEFADTLVTVDHTVARSGAHRVVRRPQCAACGDPSLTERLGRRPVVLSRGEPGTLQDGGRRAADPEATLARYEHLVSPITGVVNSLTPSTNATMAGMHVYVAGHNFALKNDSLYFLRDGLRSKSAGKGTSAAQARTGALCEAIERYSGVFRGDEPRQRATMDAMGEAAIDPNACMLFSERQFAERDRWNARGSRFQVVPLPLPRGVPVDWTPVWSLTQGRARFLPTMYCYYGYPTPADGLYCWADSNGNAAGNSLEEAILQGVLELIERDSVCLWWYSRVRRPGVDLASFHLPFVDRMVALYAETHRDLWAIDLTTDLGVAAFAAISRRTDRPVEDITLGFGCHLDAGTALTRALSEMNQFLPSVDTGEAGPSESRYAFHDREATEWWQTATLANQPYLAPLASVPARRPTDFPALATDSLYDDVAACRAILEQHGLEVLVLDQTRPDIGLTVVKVLVPGLRHFWARFAPGRLFDVPVALGWLPRVLAEEALNPIPMFL